MPDRYRAAHSQGLQRVAEGGTPRVIGTSVELQGLRKDGSEFPLELSLSRWQQGDETFFTGIIQDITVRKSARDQIDALLKELGDIKHALDEHDIVSIADERGKITFVNDKFCAISGYSREEVIGQDHRILNSGYHPQEFFRDLWATIKQGRVWKGEIKNLKKGGSFYWVAATIVPVLSSEGRPVQFVAIRTDVTAQKTVEEQLRLLNSDLENLVEKRANELKKLERTQFRNQRMESIGTLAGGVAHDLNNALAPIVIGVDLLKAAHPEDTEILNAMSASAKRGADIVQHLLNFAKGTDGERITLKPADLIAEVVKITQASFPKNIQLVTQTAPNVPSVFGDGSQLHHVLLNLCVNARDAMPRGGTLTLGADFKVLDATAASQIPGAAPGEYVVLSVRDTGTGIPTDVIDRIFDPFFTTKPAERGTGLGLSNVVGIVKGHGGFVQVYSQPGHGAAFYVYLPAEKSASNDMSKADESPTPFGHGQSILLVDDESSVRDVARLLLKRLNFEPVIAGDGAEALACVARNMGGFSAVITDMHMPRMDGLELIRAIRALQLDVPVMVCSGRLDGTERDELAQFNVNTVLAKPFNEQQLAKALNELLHNSAHRPTVSGSRGIAADR
jgi:PAS domain S-box-containing protein